MRECTHPFARCSETGGLQSTSTGRVFGSDASVAQVFYDTGKGYSEQESAVAAYQAYLPTQFLLPRISVQAIRFDPTTLPENSLRIFDIRITDDRGVDHVVIPINELQSANAISSFNLRDSSIELTYDPGNGDARSAAPSICHSGNREGQRRFLAVRREELITVSQLRVQGLS